MYRGAFFIHGWSRVLLPLEIVLYAVWRHKMWSVTLLGVLPDPHRA